MCRGPCWAGSAREVGGILRPAGQLLGLPAQQREWASLDWHSRVELKGSGDEGRKWRGRHSTYFSTQAYIAITSERERERESE